MAVHDFIDERRVLVLGTRRFEVRKPTLGALTLFLELYEGEIRLCLEVAQRAPITWNVNPIESAFAILLRENDPRAVRVVSLIVTSAEDPATWPIKDLVVASLGMSDLRRIVQELNLHSSIAATTPALGPLPIEHDIVDYADRFRCDPRTVADWPFELFLELAEVYAAKRGKASSTAHTQDRGEVDPYTFDPFDAGMPGFLSN